MIPARALIPRVLTIPSNLIAVRITLASCPCSAVSWSPSGKPFATGIGMVMADVPMAVHGAFILGSPVDDKPNGAGPMAAGTRITGVAL